MLIRAFWMAVNPACAWCPQSSTFSIKHSKTLARSLKLWQDVCPCGCSTCIHTACKSPPVHSPALIGFPGSQFHCKSPKETQKSHLDLEQPLLPVDAPAVAAEGCYSHWTSLSQGSRFADDFNDLCGLKPCHFCAPCKPAQDFYPIQAEKEIQSLWELMRQIHERNRIVPQARNPPL